MALLCHCRLVSDRRILAELSDGATSVADVQRRCGAATGCGGCPPAREPLGGGATGRPLAGLPGGAPWVADVQRRCGAATGCGGCLPAVELLVAAATTDPVGAVA